LFQINQKKQKHKFVLNGKKNVNQTIQFKELAPVNPQQKLHSDSRKSVDENPDTMDADAVQHQVKY
jgi:hypothetical protein